MHGAYRRRCRKLINRRGIAPRKRWHLARAASAILYVTSASAQQHRTRIGERSASWHGSAAWRWHGILTRILAASGISVAASSRIARQYGHQHRRKRQSCMAAKAAAAARTRHGIIGAQHRRNHQRRIWHHQSAASSIGIIALIAYGAGIIGAASASARHRHRRLERSGIIYRQPRASA